MTLETTHETRASLVISHCEEEDGELGVKILTHKQCHHEDLKPYAT